MPALLNPIVEVLVRALGLVPIVSGEARAVKTPWKLKHGFGRSVGSVATLALLTGGVLMAYASLIMMEYFSKRSSLGCPYYLFVFTWFIVALIPAGVRTYLPSPISYTCSTVQSPAIVRSSLRVARAPQLASQN